MGNREREEPGNTERRIDLERRLRILEDELDTRSAKALLTTLQSAVGDLAAAQRDLHAQLSALAARVEQLASADPDGTGKGPTPAPAGPPRAYGGPISWVRRAVRFGLRATVGTLRKVWDATHPHPPWGDQVRLVSEESSQRRWPRLSVALRDVGEDAEAALVAALEEQTDRDVEVVFSDPDGRRKAPDADYVWCAAPGFADLPSTFVETVKLLLAVEDLPFVSFSGPSAGHSSIQWIVARELWHPEKVLDLRALEKRARRRPDRPLGKAVGSPEALPHETLGPGLRQRVRQCGRYFVPASSEPRIFTHRLSPPPGAAPGSAERPTALMVTSVPLTGGLERTATAILNELAAEARWLVASTARHPDEWSRGRFRSLEPLTRGTFALADVFAEESQVEVLAHLISRHGVNGMLHLSRGPSATALQDALSLRLPDLHVVGIPLPEPDQAGGLDSVPAADGYLAVTRRIERLLRNRDEVPVERVWHLPWALDDTGGGSDETPASRAGELRRDLRLPAEALVVTMWSDLVAEKRPEDFVALAHRFRGEERYRFLLVGEGPLGAHLRDLESYFRLRNLVLEAPRLALADYLDVTDVFCTTAEQELSPYGVLAALDRGHPVVAAAVDDLEEILAAAPSGVAVPFAGDLDGFEAAIRSLAEDNLRDKSRQARHAVERQDLGEICRRALRLERTTAGRGSP